MPYLKAAPELQLTEAEERAVQDSWAELSKDLKQLGVRFFIHLFKEHPRFQPLFKAFAKIPLTELAENRRFKAHGFTVMNAVNGFIENIDDIEILRELLLKTGQNHARRQFTHQDFQIVRDVLLDFFKQELGDEWTEDTAGSWTKVLTAVVAVINEGITEYNESH